MYLLLMHLSSWDNICCSCFVCPHWGRPHLVKKEGRKWSRTWLISSVNKWHFWQTGLWAAGLFLYKGSVVVSRLKTLQQCTATGWNNYIIIGRGNGTKSFPIIKLTVCQVFKRSWCVNEEKDETMQNTLIYHYGTDFLAFRPIGLHFDYNMWETAEWGFRVAKQPFN